MIALHPHTIYTTKLLDAIEARTNAGQSLDLAIGLEVGRRAIKNRELEDQIEKVRDLFFDRFQRRCQV